MMFLMVNMRGDLTEANERQVMLETMEKLEGLWKMEEIKARQRARERCGGRQKHCLLPGRGQSKKKKKNHQLSRGPSRGSGKL